MNSDNVTNLVASGQDPSTPAAGNSRHRNLLGRVPPPVWPFLAAFVILIAIGQLAGRGLPGIASGALQNSAILVVVALGQLIVITTGNANIDLSIPSTMTLAAFVSVVVLDGDTSRLPIAIAATILCGALVGVANVLIIWIFDLPAIVATLAMAFILDSLTLNLSSSLSVGVPEQVTQIVSSSTFGMLNLVWIAIAVTAVGAFVLSRTTWGRSLSGIGQNRRVAFFAGFRWRVGEAAAFIASGVLAAIGGMLAGWDIGAEIGLGTPYLLSSVAVVVLGGTLITGGRSYVLGLWGGAVLLSLLLTFVVTLGLSTAYQNIAQGLLILLILGFASHVKRTR